MSAVTGKNLLEGILHEQDLELLPTQQQYMENLLQEVIDTGQDTVYGLAYMLGVIPQISASLEEGENLPEIVNTVVDKIEALVPVSVDTDPFPTLIEFNAVDGSYEFVDDAETGSNVVIHNFSADDVISFVNAGPDDFEMTNFGEDVWLTNHFNDGQPMNHITLTGVVSTEDVISDLDSFIAATGFNPFVV